MSAIRSIAARVRALAEHDVDFGEAERMLTATRRRPTAVPTAERAAQERREYAELLGLDVSHTISREARLRRWLGIDVASVPSEEGDET